MRVVLALALAGALASPATGAAPRADALGLVQAHRIAARWSHQNIKSAYVVWIGCKPGGRRDYAICDVNAGKRPRPADDYNTYPVVVWRRPHGYAVRLQEPALLTPNPLWLTR